MTRKTKFRVWDEISKKMWYPEAGLKACITQVGAVCTDETDEGGILENRSYRLIALFYTGLKDMNGKEIYEGDIVKLARDDKPEIRAEIAFEDGCFFYKYIINPWQHSDKTALFSNPPELNYIVIGNIYENPELLKGETK